ncbi:FAD-dependent oxidoreductase [Pseudonocardia nematodicida]|uniref:FAD-dependent oxidoreductase n=1 Tax=Pseudonocardia nematodicida TaxID=1206997 RepID=A0ABV1K5U4_9PSEU
MPTVAVVGGSVAGVRVAQALRSEGHDGRIVLVDREPHLPYDRPPLSKQFLAGGRDLAGVTLLTEEMAGRLGIELRLGSAAERLDPRGRTLRLADGTTLDWDAVVLATGADARAVPWPVSSGVHVVRCLDDARALRAELVPGAPLVVVGGGFIGAEVAATARSAGCAVTVVDPLPAPIGRVVGPEVGALFTELHHRHGVATRFGTGVAGIEGGSGRLRVLLDDGSSLGAAAVVVGIGAVPNDAWLASSGLRIEDGVVTDEHCRAVDDAGAQAAGVYAVGDGARSYRRGLGRHVRAEHWTNASEMAAVAAHNIVAPEDLRVHDPVEYVWSDQYDWKIQIAGRPVEADRHELVGSIAGDAARGAAVYAGADGRLCGAVTVNWPKAMFLCRRMLGDGTMADETLGRLRALDDARR